jgi:hypothetical protein
VAVEVDCLAHLPLGELESYLKIRLWLSLNLQ